MTRALRVEMPFLCPPECWGQPATGHARSLNLSGSVHDGRKWWQKKKAGLTGRQTTGATAFVMAAMLADEMDVSWAWRMAAPTEVTKAGLMAVMRAGWRAESSDVIVDAMRADQMAA